MDLRSVHEVVNRFQKIIFKNSNYIDSGFFVSSFKGAGLQFKEHQVYSYGDELRFIDWKMLAKKNQPYIKTFEEERNINVKFIVDCHSNFVLSHKNKSKFVSILEMCAILIIFAGKTKDTVSIYFFGEKNFVVNNLCGNSGLLKLISTLNAYGLVDDGGNPNYNNFIKYCRNDFYKEKYDLIYGLNKGPFILFSIFNDGRYDLFKKLFAGKNTHFFEIRCPFEKDEGRFIFKTTGINCENKFKSMDLFEEKRIVYLDIDKSPLVRFVEGIMSYEKRI